MKRVLFLLTFICLGIGTIAAQSAKVTGRVTDTEGEAVIGASVYVIGTNLGANTDIEGNFTIENVPSSATTLRVSYIGMTTQEVHILKGKPMKIVLVEDGVSLDEVMVVAYGTAKRSAFTGSATVVDSEELGKVQATNPVAALTGKMAGVQLHSASGQPGSSPSIRIRGISSINAGKDPLIVLDGAPFDGNLNDISTQDIESMTVLKDAASTALYGARGANGVIIVTTKNGSSGTARVTFDAKWGSNQRAAQEYDYITNPAQYYETYYTALKNYGTSKLGQSSAEAHAFANASMIDHADYGLGYNVFTIPQGEYMIGSNGRMNPNATLGRLISDGAQEYWLTPDNWLDEAYSNSLRQEYNLSVAAGNEKSNFYASVNYLNNEGITFNSNYERLTTRMKADYKVKKWLKVGANMSYTHTDRDRVDGDGDAGSSGNIFEYASSVAPIYPLYVRDANGNIMKDGNGFTRHDFGNGDYAGLIRPFLPTANPYLTNQLDVYYTEGNTFNASGFAEFTFLKNFKFTWRSGVNVAESRTSSVTNPYYGQYANSNGIVSKSHSRSFAYNHQQILNWSDSFGDNNISLMLGHESYRSKYYYLSATRKNMFDPANDELAGAITDDGGNSYTTDYNNEGYFGRALYDYDNRYYAEASYRRDASSRFHPDHRWGDFWSASFAWDISNENWFNAKWVDMLKVKASYGEQGNDQINDFLYVTRYDIVNSNGKPAAVPSTLGTKDITWETQGNFNIGVDFEFFKGRLGGTVEFFNRKTYDMLYPFPLPASYGYTSYWDNIGDMRNRGVEVELRATPIKTKDFEWNINFNVTSYKNKITYLPEERKTTTIDGKKGYTSGNLFYGEDCSLYTFYMHKYAGVNENGQSMWYYKDFEPVLNADGTPKVDAEGNAVTKQVLKTTTDYNLLDDESRMNFLCGTSLPDAYGGFGTSLSFFGFDLSVDFAYQIGGQVYDSDYAGLMSSPTATSHGSNMHKDLLNSWTPTNKTNIPRLVFGDTHAAASSDRFLTDASYLSLQNINFGYTLPRMFTKKAGIEKMRIYLAADNICYWSKRKGLDPRQSISGGASNVYYSPIRTISGGVTLTF